MANIVSNRQFITDVEVNADAALSENLFENIGGSINYLIDTTDDHETRLDALDQLAVSRTDVNYTVGTSTPTSETTLATISSVTVPSGGRVLFLFTDRVTSTILPQSSSGFSANVFKVFTTITDTVTVRLKRDSTAIITAPQSIGSSTQTIIGGTFAWIDQPSAGTYNYTLTWQFGASVASVTQSAVGSIYTFILP